MTQASGADAVFTLRGIQQMLGLSRPAILGLVDAGFVTPARGPRNVYRFTFQDVVLLRTAQTLRAADIPARRIVRALKRLRELLPDTVPLTGLRISAIGDDVAVREAGRPMAVESGQMLFDFAVEPAGSVLAFPALDLPGATARHPAPDTTVDAFLELGAVLHEARSFDEALEVYERGIAQCPADAALRYNRAIVLEDLGRIDDALEEYEACIRLAPDFADAHWNVARLYEQRGGVQEALRHFSAFRRLQR